jgi:hypothetical protein
MAVVSGGLGQPESGAIVAAGLGASGTPSGFRNATITVTATATSSITADVLVREGPQPEPPPTSGGGWDQWTTPRKPKRRKRTRYITAELHVHCQSSATIHADALINFDAELEELLLVGAI